MQLLWQWSIQLTATAPSCHRYSRNLQFCLLGVWGLLNCRSCKEISLMPDAWHPFVQPDQTAIRILCLKWLKKILIFFPLYLDFFACIPVGGLSSACNFIYVSFLVFVFVLYLSVSNWIFICACICVCVCALYFVFLLACVAHFVPPVSTPAIPQPNFLHLILSPMCCSYFASTAMCISTVQQLQRVASL